MGNGEISYISGFRSWVALAQEGKAGNLKWGAASKILPDGMNEIQMLVNIDLTYVSAATKKQIESLQDNIPQFINEDWKRMALDLMCKAMDEQQTAMEEKEKADKAVGDYEYLGYSFDIELGARKRIYGAFLKGTETSDYGDLATEVQNLRGEINETIARRRKMLALAAAAEAYLDAKDKYLESKGYESFLAQDRYLMKRLDSLKERAVKCDDITEDIALFRKTIREQVRLIMLVIFMSNAEQYAELHPNSYLSIKSHSKRMYGHKFYPNGTTDLSFSVTEKSQVGRTIYEHITVRVGYNNTDGKEHWDFISMGDSLAKYPELCKRIRSFFQKL